MDQAGFNFGTAITAILPMAQSVYTGDEDGRVVRIHSLASMALPGKQMLILLQFEWDCIQRQ